MTDSISATALLKFSISDISGMIRMLRRCIEFPEVRVDISKVLEVMKPFAEKSYSPQTHAFDTKDFEAILDYDPVDFEKLSTPDEILHTLQHRADILCQLAEFGITTQVRFPLPEIYNTLADLTSSPDLDPKLQKKVFSRLLRSIMTLEDPGLLFEFLDFTKNTGTKLVLNENFEIGNVFTEVGTPDVDRINYRLFELQEVQERLLDLLDDKLIHISNRFQYSLLRQSFKEVNSNTTSLLDFLEKLPPLAPEYYLRLDQAFNDFVRNDKAAELRRLLLEPKKFRFHGLGDVGTLHVASSTGRPGQYSRLVQELVNEKALGCAKVIFDELPKTALAAKINFSRHLEDIAKEDFKNTKSKVVHSWLRAQYQILKEIESFSGLGLSAQEIDILLKKNKTEHVSKMKL